MLKALVLQITAVSDDTSITVQTALLLIVAAVLAIVVKELLQVRRRVSDLESRMPQAADRVNSSDGFSAASSDAASQNQISADTVAAITAAVHLVCDSPHRIVAINAPPPEHQQAWSSEGRRQVFQSHRVR